MPRADAFEVEGVTVRRLSDRCFVVRLANGHELMGHLRRSNRPLGERLAAGDGVRVEVTPYDLSQGVLVDKITV